MPFSLKLIKYLSFLGHADNTRDASVLKWLQVLLEKKLTPQPPMTEGKWGLAEQVCGVCPLGEGLWKESAETLIRIKGRPRD